MALCLTDPRFTNLTGADVRKLIPGLTSSTLSRNNATYKAQGNFEPRKRPAKAGILGPADIAKMQAALRSKGTGKRRSQSLKKAHPRVVAEGATPGCRETYRKGLHKDNWKPQKIKKVLPHKLKDCIARASFCRREARRIANEAAYSDSKVYVGEHSAKTNLGTEWAPEDAPPTQQVPSKHPYQGHAYMAITKHGATPLHFTHGTWGPTGRGPGRPKTSNVPPPAPAAAPKRKYVDAAVYQKILDDGVGGGMLPEVRALFEGHCTRFRFQQDGAPAHSVSRNPKNKGFVTRGVIERHASLVENWPANSADLSAAEKAWFTSEHDVWANETWHNLPTFKAALQRHLERPRDGSFS